MVLGNLEPEEYYLGSSCALQILIHETNRFKYFFLSIFLNLAHLSS